MCGACVLGLAMSAAWSPSRPDETPAPRDVAPAAVVASTPAQGADGIAGASQFARARVIVKGRIDESRFAALQVEVVERRANGQLIVLVPADRLEAFRALPGSFTARISTPANPV
jgi:hypothetical protein